MQNSGDGRILQQHTIIDPRAEWALRWLLKKLQNSDLSPSSPHLKPKTWVLLQELVVRVPLTSVARLLCAHHFTRVLRDTLGWLQKKVNRVTVSSDVEFGNEESFDPPDDSSDTVESSSSERRASKKRRLDGTEVNNSENDVKPATGAFRILYLTICGTVKQLLSLVTDPEQKQGYAVEYMKSSLRSPPEDVAHILGSSFYLTNRLIQTPQKHRHQGRVFTRDLQRLLAGTGYKSCIIPMIDLWNRRSLIEHSSTSSNVRNPQILFGQSC